MIIQKRNPYPSDWWGQKFGGLSRDAWTLIGIGVALVLVYGTRDWNWILGFR